MDNNFFSNSKDLRVGKLFQQIVQRIGDDNLLKNIKIQEEKVLLPKENLQIIFENLSKLLSVIGLTLEKTENDDYWCIFYEIISYSSLFASKITLVPKEYVRENITFSELLELLVSWSSQEEEQELLEIFEIWNSQ